MIALGLVLLLLGWLFAVHVLVVIGVLLLVIGVVLNVVPTGGRRGRWY